MTPENANTSSSGPRPAKLRILMPIVLAVAALVVFLALFWPDGGSGKKSHRRTQAASGRSPVGGQDELEDLGNTRATGGSPVGGGPSQPGRKRAKGEEWWSPDAKSGSGRAAEGDQWWAPEGGKAERSGSESPVGGASADRESPVGGKPRAADKPARPSTRNPGEAAGSQGGPDDFWWRK
jgi:hypothetical protein